MTTAPAIDVAARLRSVREEIADAALRVGRDPAAITLVAVTKRVGEELVRAAMEAGQRDFGENYVQEGLAKIDAIDRPDVNWHLIGGLQSNKAARAARAFRLLHSVTSASVVRAISREMVSSGDVAKVLLQVRLGDGEARAGIDPGAALATAILITNEPGLSLEGVMGVAPVDEAPRPHFARLAAVLDELRKAGLPRAPLREMSAGMTGDFRDAIAEGATIVRIGTAIFGRRDP